MTSKEDLINIVLKFNRKQLLSVIYDFEMIGFYREDKIEQRQFIIDCIVKCYTIERSCIYGTLDTDSILMEKSIINAMKGIL